MIPKKPIRFEHEESARIDRAIRSMAKVRGPDVPAWPNPCSEPEYGARPIECSHPTREFIDGPFGTTPDNYVGICKWSRCRP